MGEFVLRTRGWMASSLGVASEEKGTRENGGGRRVAGLMRDYWVYRTGVRGK